MKYLKVKYNGGIKSFLSIEGLAKCIKDNYPNSISSVEICNEEDQVPKFPEIKKVEMGVLDIGEGLTICHEERYYLYKHGNTVDLNSHSELRQYCINIKTGWDLIKVEKHTIIEIYIKNDPSPRYGRFICAKNGFLFLEHECAINLETISSVRIVEVPRQ